ncbi:MAG: HAMP domain-containing protein [Chloroflexi bacterium]|nr:HAMP domain-containing protein [Chloroflexota bacterium]
MKKILQSSLLIKLTGAFLLVILIGALVIYFLTSHATRSAFRVYTTQSGQAWAARLAPAFANYYADENNWVGVESLIETIDSLPPGMMMRWRNRQGNPGRGWGMMGGWMHEMGQRLILADAQGTVIADTGGELTGSRLMEEELAGGAPVIVEGQQVGTLIVSPLNLQAVPNPADTFLSSVNRSILISVLIAGGISLILVLVFSLHITAPVREMQKAAGEIARGNLNQRVPERSNDELGDLARSFNHMAGSLASAEEQRRKMVADIAHELRTPLAVIQANTEAMQDGVLPLDHAQVDAIHAEAMLLGRLIDDLRLISLAEGGELHLEREEIDLGNLLRLAAERIRPQCQQKEVDLILQVQDGLPHVCVDGDRITQVVNNLIGNALRYVPSGGKITVRAEGTSEGVAVSVIDTGSGIAPEDLPWVFDRFYRADKSRARASGGSGLGLAIVKQLVEAHGGSVSAASPVFTAPDQRGYGARFTFTLPIA